LVPETACLGHHGTVGKLDYQILQNCLGASGITAGCRDSCCHKSGGRGESRRCTVIRSMVQIEGSSSIRLGQGEVSGKQTSCCSAIDFECRGHLGQTTHRSAGVPAFKHHECLTESLQGVVVNCLQQCDQANPGNHIGTSIVMWTGNLQHLGGGAQFTGHRPEATTDIESCHARIAD